MRNLLHMRRSLIALAALAAFSAQAVVLGNIRNTVYVGKAFNANIELSDYQSPSLCISTELYYGESRLSATSHTLKGNTLRVRNSTPIYEPIVTLTVTADCTNPVTRKYTLFAEAPMVIAPAEIEDELAQSDAASAPAKAPRRREDTDNFFGVAGGPTLGSESVPAIAPSPKPSKRKARAATQTRTAPKRNLGSYGSASISGSNTPSALAAESTAPQLDADARPRLELSNFDWTISDPGLRASPELLSVGGNTDPAAREIARARWAALSAQIDGLASDASLHATQQDFLGLTEQIKTRDEQIATLRAQLHAQENSGIKWRDVWPWLIGLLLVAALIPVGKRWRKVRARAQRKQERQKEVWWQHEDGLVDHDSVDMPPPVASVGSGQNRATRFTEQLPVPEVQDLDKASASKEFPEFFVSGLDEAAMFVGGNQSRQATEVLLDTQQQVDFFLALGQYDKAIDILKNHINENDETSPLVYLDLLNVYNIAGRESSFEELRTKFNQLFNANVADFANYRVNSRGLETYENVIARIQTHWNTPKVINLIEESVFRRSGVASEEAFDPLAYRELLMLYGIAIETSETESNLYRVKPQQQAEVNHEHSSNSIAFTTDELDPPAFSSTIPVSDFDLEDEGNTALSPLSAAEPSFSAFTSPQGGGDSLVDLDLGAAHSGESLDLDLGLALADDSAIDFDLSQSAPLEGMSITMGTDLDFSLDDEPATPAPGSKKG